MKLSEAAAQLSSLMFLCLALVFAGCQSSEEEESAPPANSDAPVVVQDQESHMGDDAVAAKERARARLEALLQEAREKANNKDYEGALVALDQALTIDPTNDEAARQRDEIVSIMRSGPPGETTDTKTALAREQARQEKARNYFEAGLRYRAEGRLDKAVEELQKAYALVKFGNAAFDLTEGNVKSALDDAVRLRDESERLAEQRHRDEVNRIQREQEERERKTLERRLAQLWDNALLRFENEEFQRCEWICDEILTLDYSNEHAKRLKETARQARHAIAQQRNMADYRREWNAVFQELKEANIVQTELVQYPDADMWKRIASRNDLTLGDQTAATISDADREISNRLANTLLPKVDWKGKTIKEIGDELAAQSNVNLIVTPAAISAAGDAGEIGFEFNNITAERALQAVCAQLKVTFTVGDEIVKVQTLEESRKHKIIQMYDVKDLVNEIKSYPGVKLNLNPSGFQTNLEEELSSAQDVSPTKSFVDVDKLIDIIKRAVDPGWDDDDGNQIQDKTGTLVVRQTPDRHRLIRNLLADLRKGVGLQVNIEARFITVENNFLQEIGVDLRGLGDDSAGVGQAGVGTNRTFDDFGISGVGFGAATSTQLGNRRQPFGALGVGSQSQSPTNTNTTATTPVPGGIGLQNDSGVTFQDFTNADLRARTENLFDEFLSDNSRLTNSGGSSFQFAFLDDVQLEAILRAVQKYERVNTLIAPNLTVFNTQRANLTVINEISYVKDYDVEIAQAAVIADPIIDKVREGVVLDVRPIVSHDRRYVTLEMRPQVATLVRPIRMFTTNLAVGSAVTLQLPELHKEAVNTTVVVPDGGTLLLGGLKYAEEKSFDSGVPILKDIPILGFFFSRTGKFTSLRDLIVLLKVKILIMEELEPGSPETTAR